MTDFETTLATFGRVADIAEGQYGHVTRTQATMAGLSADTLEQLLRSGVVEVVTAEVIRIRGGGRAEFPELYAEWLCLDPATPAWERLEPACAVVSHGAALRVYGIPAEPRPGMKFTVPPGVLVRRSPTVTIHHAALRDDQVQRVAGLPVTSPARTFGDVAPLLDIEDLLRIADALTARGWTTREQLRTELTADPPEDLSPALSAGLLSALAR